MDFLALVPAVYCVLHAKVESCIPHLTQIIRLRCFQTKTTNITYNIQVSQVHCITLEERQGLS